MQVNDLVESEKDKKEQIRGQLPLDFFPEKQPTLSNFIVGSNSEAVAVISELKESGATFEDAMAKVEELYGLTTKEGEALSLTATDVESLRKAWNVAMGTQEIDKAEASLLYGGYNPFSMAVSHIMNNKAGLSYTSYAHTGLQIPVYAYGVGAEKFSGLYDNTGIFTRTMDAMGLTPDAE